MKENENFISENFPASFKWLNLSLIINSNILYPTTLDSTADEEAPSIKTYTTRLDTTVEQRHLSIKTNERGGRGWLLLVRWGCYWRSIDRWKLITIDFIYLRDDRVVCESVPFLVLSFSMISDSYVWHNEVKTGKVNRENFGNRLLFEQRNQKVSGSTPKKKNG